MSPYFTNSQENMQVKNGQKQEDRAPSGQVQLRIYEEKWGRKMEKGRQNFIHRGASFNRFEPCSPIPLIKFVLKY